MLKLSQIQDIQSNRQSHNENLDINFNDFTHNINIITFEQVFEKYELIAFKKMFAAIILEPENYKLDIFSNFYDVMKDTTLDEQSKIDEIKLCLQITNLQTNVITIYHNFKHYTTHYSEYVNAYLRYNYGNNNNSSSVKKLLTMIINLLVEHCIIDDDTSSNDTNDFSEIDTLFSGLHDVNGETFTNVKLKDGTIAFAKNTEDGLSEIINQEGNDVNIQAMINEQREKEEAARKEKEERIAREQERLQQEQAAKAEELRNFTSQLSEQQLMSIIRITDALNQERNLENITYHATQLGYI